MTAPTARPLAYVCDPLVRNVRILGAKACVCDPLVRNVRVDRAGGQNATMPAGMTGGHCAEVLVLT